MEMHFHIHLDKYLYPYEKINHYAADYSVIYTIICLVSYYVINLLIFM